MNTPRELFLYELGIMRDAERTGRLLLNSIGGRVRDSDLAQILRTQEQGSEQQLTNIGSCLQALGAAPLETPSPTVQGMRGRFEVFTHMRPSAEMLDLFALSTAIRFVYFGIAGYKGLVDWAVLIGESQCAQCLETNLVQKEQSAGKLERVAHEMGGRLLAAA